jgi:hypothetical protein
MANALLKSITAYVSVRCDGGAHPISVQDAAVPSLLQKHVLQSLWNFFPGSHTFTPSSKTAEMK